MCHFRETVIPRTQEAKRLGFLSSLPNTASDKGVVWTLNQWHKVSRNDCSAIRGHSCPDPTQSQPAENKHWLPGSRLPEVPCCHLFTDPLPGSCWFSVSSSNSFLSHRIGFCCLRPRSPSHFIPSKNHSNDTRERLLESKLGNRVASIIRNFGGNYLVTKEILSGRKGRVVKISILHFTCFYHEALLVIWPFTRVGWEKWWHVPYKWINRANYFKP